MITISLCMIVKDEELVLERCLNSIYDLVDEIIIVDTGSKDKTKDIAKKFTNNIYDFKWINDFSKARNFSYSKATKEYILWMDADDVLFEEDRKKFKVLKDTLDKNVDSVKMNYNTNFDEDGNVTFSFKRNRLTKREKNFKWEGACHNLLKVSGNIIDSDIGFAHLKLKERTDRNLKIYQGRLKKGEFFNDRDNFYYANELYEHKLYKDALIYYNMVIKSNSSWFENKIYSCNRVADYYFYINDYENAFNYLFNTFKYIKPRGESCCKIGNIFKKIGKLEEAIYWYKVASNCKIPETNGFIQNSYYNIIPYLQLCVCYDKLGDLNKAFEYNELARKYSKDNESVINNIEYFKSLGYDIP